MTESLLGCREPAPAKDSLFTRLIGKIRRLCSGTVQPTQQEQLPLPESKIYSSLDTVIQSALHELDTLTEFAIAALNPFASRSELAAFAHSKNYGQNNFLYIYPPKGSGERIQMEYLLQFFCTFFPKLEIRYHADSRQLPVDKNLISIDILDYEEYGIDDIHTLCTQFSIQQLKIIHSNPCSEITRKRVRAGLIEAIQSAYKTRAEEMPLPTIPIVLGSIHSNECNFSPPFRLLELHDNKLTSTLFLHTDQPKHETTLTLQVPFCKRALYAGADVAIVGRDKNKVEAVQSGASVRVPGGTQFTTDRSNSNHVVDSKLFAAGVIQMVVPHQQQNLESRTEAHVLQEREIAELCAYYLKNMSRLHGEPLLRQSMKTVFDKMI